MSARVEPGPGLSAVDHDPFAGSALARVVPTTESQREIWLAAQLETAASLAYNEAITLELHGPLDALALRAACAALVARHEALRATFSADGAEMHIAAEAAPDMLESDLSALDEPARTRAVDAVLARAVAQAFDLERGPLLRVELLRLDADRHLLVVAAHHLVCDGWSFGVLVRELGVLYSAALRGEPPVLGDADSFADFALGDAVHRQGDAFRDDEAYWLGRFAEIPPPLDLPLDRPRPLVRGFASRREDLLLDAGLVAAIKRAGARQGASLFATMLAGFAVLLRRIGAGDDIVVGIPAAGQAVAGHDALVGHAVNVLPVRLQLGAGAAWAATLVEVRTRLLDAFEHQQYTVGSLLRRLAIERDPSRLPLVGLLFNLDPGLDDDRLGFEGIAARFAGVARSHENFELFLNAVQVGGAIRLECQYASALFDGASVARWLELYATLLRAVAAAAAEESVDRLTMLSARAEAELRALQPMARAFAATRRIESLVFEVAARAPARTAIRFGERTVSYGELMARSQAVARALHALGAGPGMLVGILVERSPDMVAAMLGVLASGATYVPLDPAFPRERLAFMARDAGLGVLLVDRPHAGAIEPGNARLLFLEEAVVAAGSVPDAAPDADAVAYVIYTSGSTGTPKGVRVPHRGVVNFLASMRREPGLGEDARLLAVTTLSFDIAVLELLLPLSTGACVVLATREQAGDGHALRALIEAHAVTTMQATPSTWRLLLGAGWSGREDFVALCGGEALPRDLAVDLAGRCAALWNMYGPTETTVWSTCARIEATAATIPIGRPIDNTQVWILDAHGQACAVGIAGEIAIGGAGVACGYLDRPELSADRFVADPFADDPAARLYRTGDRGRWRNDGMLEHLGRLDFQVKLRGFRIELGDVEENLLRHPAVERAVGIVREDRAGDQRLVAYLVMANGAEVDDAALRAHLRALLPDYMLPQHLVRLAALPLLPNGKLDRARLPAPLAAAATLAPSAQHVAPATPLEQRIGAAMEEVLSLPGIGLHDDFFALGGHSLLAAQLTTRLGREFDLVLSLGLLFEAPTIAGLAEALSARLAATAEGDSARIPARVDQQHAPLSLLQTRLWLFEQLNPGTVVYNTPSAHRLRGELDEAAFAAAFAALVQRQAVLRTSIVRDGTDLVQRVHAHVPLALFPAEDLSGIAEPLREAELLRRLDALTDEPLALDVAPLFRARMFRLSATHHVLFFMPHHIIWDGWSFDILYTELSELYAAQRQGRAVRLPALPVSYGDFSAWHARWLESDGYRRQFDRQHARWRERLRASGPLPPLPTDMPRPPKERVGRGETEWLAIPAAATEAARALGRQADATLFMTLLTVYLVLLWRVGGHRQMVVGTPVRVRASADVEPVMGLFTNLLPVPFALLPAERFIDMLGRVKAAVLEALASPDVQLEDLLREAGMRELAGSGRLYQAQFSYQDARARERHWAGLEQEQVLLFQRAANEDLAIWFLEHGNGMTGGVLYDADLFEADTARRLAADYVHLLERVVADPQASVVALSSAFAGATAAPTRAIDERTESLAARFEAACVRHPDRVAVRSATIERTFAQLDRDADHVASWLRADNVAAESLVAVVVVDGSVACVASLLGILKSGAVAVVVDGGLDDVALATTLAAIGADAFVGNTRRALDVPGMACVWIYAQRGDAPALNRAANVPSVDATQPALAMCLDIGGAMRVQALSHRDLGAALDDVASRLGLCDADGVAVLDGTAAPLSAFVLLLALRAGATFVANATVDGRSATTVVDAGSADVVFAAPPAWQAIGAPRRRLRHAIIVDAAATTSPDTRLAEQADTCWLAFGGAHGPLPMHALQPLARVGDLASAARPVLAPLSIRLRGDDGEDVLPGHVGFVEAHTPDGLWSRDGGRGAPWMSSRAPVQAAVRARLLSGARLQQVAEHRTGEAPDRPALAPQQARAMPDTVAEKWLAAQWQDLIGAATIGVDDNFFDLGGHSLLAMSLLATVEKQTGIRLGLLKLANGSLGAVAAEIPEAAISAGPAKAAGTGRRMLRLFGLEHRDDDA